eukprot:GAHX01001458.1.p1 GENE.GAHX01001458.1~~GAHX01001458.1.p1  ORF type:complete len:330 (-),score=64.03 GAHX01001458.1:77-1066(-)
MVSNNKNRSTITVSDGLEELINNIRNCEETSSFSQAISSFGTERFYKLLKSESFDVGFTRPLSNALLQPAKSKKKRAKLNLERTLDNIINIIWLRLLSLSFLPSRFRFKVNANLKRTFRNYNTRKSIFKVLKTTDHFEHDIKEATEYHRVYMEASTLAKSNELGKLNEVDKADDMKKCIFGHFLMRRIFGDECHHVDSADLENYNLIDFSKDLEYTPQDMLVLLHTSNNEEILNETYKKLESLLESTGENKSGANEKLVALSNVKTKQSAPGFVFDNRWVKMSKRATMRQGNVEDKNLDRIDNKAKFKKDQLKMKYSKLGKRKRKAGRK